MGAAKTACWVILLLAGDLLVARFPMTAEAQVVAAPHLSSVSLAFAPQVVDTSSVPKVIVITNQSPLPLFIFEVRASVDFAARHNCSRPLRRGQSCQILVRFSPSFPGGEQGTVTILDSSGTSPHTIRVSGAGMLRAGEERASQ
jgi:Protein of unknown function (DUF1573)